MPDLLPNLIIEEAYDGIVAGIDEAGRGPWAGPVVAAAVILDKKNIPSGMNDSKKLSTQKREKLFEEIQRKTIVGVGIVDVTTIDKINILNATKQAMITAFLSLQQKPAIALIDGNQPPDLPCKAVPIVKGDSKSLSIAAASIIAKVTRDRIMHNLHQQFPHYGWDKNAGYGTKQHQDALKLYGVSPHHRRSYAPIRKLLDKKEYA